MNGTLATVRVESLALVALTTLSCSRQHPSPVDDAGETRPLTCDGILEVETRVLGSWLGPGTTDGNPRLSVRVVDPQRGPERDREIVSLELALPFFAADITPSDLCSDDGSSHDELAVRCVVGRGRIGLARVRREGDALVTRVDDNPPKRWQLAHSERACFNLRGFDTRGDLEPVRSAWGRDIPGARCDGASKKSTVNVFFDFPATRSPYHCNGTKGPSSTTNVVLSIPSIDVRRDLGTMSNQCAGMHPTRYEDANAVRLVTSDDSTEHRFAYRLGDRLYFSTKEGSISSVELPCGASASFVVRYPWREGLIASEPPARLRSD